MPGPNLLNAGILLNAAVSGMVGIAALMLAIFLLRRWQQLGWAMRSYALFWIITVMVWFPISARYLLITINPEDILVHLLDILLQASVFFGGPPLLAFLVLRITDDRRLASRAAILSTILGIIALAFVVQPTGLIPQGRTFFSAETVPNATSLLIFSAESSLIFFLLLFDLGKHLRQYYVGRSPFIYEALYSLPVMVYLVLGSIEQIGLVADFTLVIFRILYAGAFLSVFLLVTEHETAAETFLIKPNIRRNDAPTS